MAGWRFRAKRQGPANASRPALEPTCDGNSRPKRGHRRAPRARQKLIEIRKRLIHAKARGNLYQAPCLRHHADHGAGGARLRFLSQARASISSPRSTSPIVTVTTTLRGAAPEEVETQVSKRIEEAVNTISGIDDLRSTRPKASPSSPSSSCSKRIPKSPRRKFATRSTAFCPSLPKDADPPVIEKVATDASPILNVAVSSPRDLRETTKMVDDKIKKNIESLRGVGQVRFVGERQRQIQVWLDGEKLYSYNLNVEQIRAALAAQNVEIPGGRVDQGARELSLRTMGRVDDPQDFERIVVATVGGTPDSHRRHRPRGRRIRRAALARPAQRDAGRRARSPKAGRHEYAGCHPGHQDAHRRAAEIDCRRISKSPTRAINRSSSRIRSTPCRST